MWDSDPVLPVARAADAGRVGQHGLEIVMAVCQIFEARREPVGKRITAGIALLDDPGGIPSGRPLRECSNNRHSTFTPASCRRTEQGHPLAGRRP
ncbi:hypothetical protein SUDANB126_07054 [Streptomyces sp. enrichment culture]